MVKKWYNLLGMSESALKQKIHESETAKDKWFYFFVLALRALLVVCFAVLFVSILSGIFGEEFSAMAVVMLVIVLTIRFVPFNYCIQDTLIGLAVVMVIFVVSPSLALMVPDGAVFFVHLISFSVLLLITTQRPEMGLGGMMGFAYIYLAGNPIEELLLSRRIGMALVSYVICAAILIHQHRNKYKEVRLKNYVKGFSLSDPKCLWQIRLALGVAIILTIGEVMDVPRFTWLAFPCSSILAVYPYSGNTQTRLWERIEGIAAGSVGFYLLCQLIPESAYSMIGLVGGFCLGFCTKYRAKTITICFSALSVAVALYGVEGSSFLRIRNNVIGAVFAALFALLFDRVFAQHFLKKKEPHQKAA